MPPRPNLVCCHCGRSFKPDRFNHHHQKYCGLPECTAARDRSYRQQSTRQRLADDPLFRERERIRCREAMCAVRARRKAAMARAAPPAPPSPPEESAEPAGAQLFTLTADSSPPEEPAEPLATSTLAIYGVISQLIGSTDSDEVRRATMGYADRGRRLTAGGLGGGTRSG